MQKITWKVEFTSLPRIKRYCKKCGTKSNFVSSQLFRVNANQKNLDIWLIYKCLGCKTTWKQELFSRVKPSFFSGETLENFHRNDTQLAWEYAMDCGKLARLGLEVTPPGYCIVGEDVAPINSGSKEQFEIQLFSDYPFDIKISAILKAKLAISGSQLEKVIKSGNITCNTNANFKKCKLQKEQILGFTL